MGLGCFGLLACTTITETAPSTDDDAGDGGAGGSGGGAIGEPEPAPQFMPTSSGNCPQLVDGMLTFSPPGVAAREAQVWVGDPAIDGPLIFYWHGNGSSPNEVNFGLGAGVIEAVKAQGGMIVAPTSDPSSGQFDWFLTTGDGAETDLVLADEILACGIEQVGIDTRRIHSIGMSAGGLNTSQMSYRRSGYLASIVAYSGGKLGSPPIQDESNKLPAMLFHGGPQDVVIINFKTISEALRDDMQARGHFVFICDHGTGHTIPPGSGDHAWQFFQDHPFGTSPDAYQDALPATFPAYCAL